MSSTQEPSGTQLDEGGTLVVLLALLSLTIFGLVAFAVDATIAASARAQHAHTAENCALGALEEYLAYVREHPLGPGAGADATAAINIEALNKAASRASEIAKMNINVSVGRAFFTDPTKPQHSLGASLGLDGGTRPIPSAAENGTIIPGIWHFVAPKAPAPPACGSDTARGFEPCFVPLPRTERANAVRVELHLNDESPLGTIFARALGQRSVTFSSTSTASLVPRHAVFLVDLSPSIYRDTHLHYSYLDRSAQYALALEPAAYNGTTFVSGWQSMFVTTGPYDGTYRTLQLNDQASWDIMKVNRPTSQTVPIQTEHYRSEYTPVAVKSVSPPDLYAIDSLIKPQPLTDVLSGIHLAMRRFNERSVPSDLLSIIGFDDTEVTCTETACNTPRAMPLMSPNMASGLYAGFFNATDPDVPITSQSKLDRYLFPRRFGSLGNGQPPFSDLRSALHSAVEMLKDQGDSFKVADNFIVLFSDGKNNCMTAEEHADAVAATPAGTAPPPRCWNSEPYFTNTFEELRRELEGGFGDKRVSFHMVLVGKDAGPHTLLLKSPTGGCMTDGEARAHADAYGNPDPLPLVNPNDTTGMGDADWSWPESDNKPFYPVNQLYYGTVATRGLYLPLRPCCTLDGGECNTERAPDIATKLNALCNQAAEVGRTPPPTATTDSEALNRMLVMSKGRLMCDPQGRPPGEQIKQAIEQIMSQNPFVLVE